MIAAGTWFATQDLANQVEMREAELAALMKRLDTQKDFTITLLGLTQGEAQDAVFVQAAQLLKSLQLGKSYQSVIDLAMPMLQLRPKNGTALAFVGYGYRGLGDMPEAKRRLQNYIAEADNVAESRDGARVNATSARVDSAPSAQAGLSICSQRWFCDRRKKCSRWR